MERALDPSQNHSQQHRPITESVSTTAHIEIKDDDDDDDDDFQQDSRRRRRRIKANKPTLKQPPAVDKDGNVDDIEMDELLKDFDTLDNNKSDTPIRRVKDSGENTAVAIDLCSEFDDDDLDVIDLSDLDDLDDLDMSIDMMDTSTALCSSNITQAEPEHKRGSQANRVGLLVNKRQRTSDSTRPTPSPAPSTEPTVARSPSNTGLSSFPYSQEREYHARDSDHDDIQLIEDDIGNESARVNNIPTSNPNVIIDSAGIGERLEYLTKEKAQISDHICDLEFDDEIGNENEISLLRQKRIDIMKEIKALKERTKDSQPTTTVTPPAAPTPAPVPAPVPTADYNQSGNYDPQPTVSKVSHNNDVGRYTKTNLIQPSDPEPNRQAVNYPWTKDVKKALHQVFHMESFRSRQLEAINATLQGKDVFVLMPTGGGKSLCFQLPAIVLKGTTRGVTVVVSPLLSLMQDQVEHLVHWGVPALSLTGTLSAPKRKKVFEEVNQNEPRLRLLYVTPEMLNRSSQTQSALDNLYRRNQLARFVVDEAHCLSQWGHDFRPDYTQIGVFHQKYPDIPFMALTATANAKVRMDIVSNLHMHGCTTITSSFNRPNLLYEIRPKTKQVVADIHALIMSRHPGESGIIYCTSKKSCEEIAARLRAEFSLKAEHYHAGLEKEDRAMVQRKWQHNELQVVVATVALGMGIDKPDVRFVIHYSLPNSLEGYYQETGRAGRDGKPAICVMFYAYGDKRSVEFMIDKGDGDAELKDRQRQQLRQVVQFCANVADCRRQLILSYFGEQFDKSKCQKTCDNCRRQTHGQVVEKDLTKETRALIQTIEAQISNSQPTTLLQLIDIVKGSKNQKTLGRGDHRMPGYNVGKSLSKSDAERLCHHLVLRQVFDEYCMSNAMGFASAYLKLGPAAKRVMDGQLQVTLQLTDPDLTKTTGPKARKAKNARSGGRTLPSTSTSSTSRRGNNSRTGLSWNSDTISGGAQQSTVVTNSTSSHFQGSRSGGGSGGSSIKPMSIKNR